MADGNPLSAREAWQVIADHHRITRIPKPTFIGGLLCRFGRHRWIPAGTTSRVLPTGTALLVYRRDQHYRCERANCEAKRDDTYRRETFDPKPIQSNTLRPASDLKETPPHG